MNTKKQSLFERGMQLLALAKDYEESNPTYAAELQKTALHYFYNRLPDLADDELVESEESAPQADDAQQGLLREAGARPGAKIFVCYPREDQGFVYMMVQALSARGIYAWMDILNIKPGTKWTKTIKNALQTCTCLIAVISPHWEEADFVEKEVLYAEDQGKLLIPVIYKGDEIPFLFNDIQCIMLASDYEAGFNRLVATLKEQCVSAA